MDVNIDNAFPLQAICQYTLPQHAMEQARIYTAAGSEDNAATQGVTDGGAKFEKLLGPVFDDDHKWMESGNNGEEQNFETMSLFYPEITGSLIFYAWDLHLFAARPRHTSYIT